MSAPPSDKKEEPIVIPPPCANGKWTIWEGVDKDGNFYYDPHEENVGPLYCNNVERKSGFYSELRHCNSSFNVHGGMILTLCDQNMFVASAQFNEGPSVTATLNVNFVSGVGIGKWVEAQGRVVRSTKSLIFVVGEVYTGEQTVATYSGVIKKIKSSRL